MAVIAMQSAASGLRALDTRLDVIANNLANVNTEGFKSARVNFEDLLYIERAQPGVENNNGDQKPTGLYVGLGVRVSGTQQDFGQGSPVPGSKTDMMIQGRGFFKVSVEDSLGSGGEAYTRAGNFVPNAKGEAGARQLRRTGASFPRLPSRLMQRWFTVDGSGQVTVNTPGASSRINHRQYRTLDIYESCRPQTGWEQSLG